LEADSKIWFKLPDGGTESLWATKLSDNNYLLENSPFYAYGVSFKDIVSVKTGENAELIFDSVVSRSGHSTYRIFLLEPLNRQAFRKFWGHLEAIGCTYEQASDKYYSIDIPKSTNVIEVYDILQKAEEDSIWEFEEAHCGHQLH